MTKVFYVQAPLPNGNGHHKKADGIPGGPPEQHPLSNLMGKYKDDPEFEEYVQLMKKLRQEELEQDLRRLDEAEAK